LGHHWLRGASRRVSLSHRIGESIMNLKDEDIPDYIRNKDVFKVVFEQLLKRFDGDKDKAMDGAQILLLKTDCEKLSKENHRLREIAEKTIMRVGSVYAGYNRLKKQYPNRSQRGEFRKAFFEMVHTQLGLQTVDNNPNTRPRIENIEN